MAITMTPMGDDRVAVNETEPGTRARGDQVTDPAVMSSDVTFDHVLVPLDGTKSALSAIPTAHALAERFGAEVHAISVADEPAAAGARLRVGRVAVEAEPGEQKVDLVGNADPATAIARRAEELGSCLVVMSTRARGRFGGAVLGSVTRSVSTQVGPVVALGPIADRPMWTPPPVRWPPPLSVDRIVACVDGSRGSEVVLPVAAGWARSLGMSLSVLMFVEDAPDPLRRGSGEPRFDSTNDPNEYVAQLASRWGSDDLMTDSWVLREPIGPGSGIRSHLADHPAGLVAVSTRARSGLQRVLRGSAADKIVRASVAPCLVVPQ